MIQMLELVLLNFLFLTIRSTTGKVLPPQSLSMVWKSDFEPQFSWEPPQHLMTNCEYEGITKTRTEGSDVFHLINYGETNYSYFWIMEGGFLHFSIKTLCNKTETSEPVVFEVTYPELVKNLECYSYATQIVKCSWSPASNAADLHFFYSLVKESSDETPAELQKCSSYKSTGDRKTGCDLEATTNHAIHIVFNATLNNTLVRNTFRKKPLFNVKPPPLKWTITESKDSFNISWIPPDVLKLSAWEFVINYTECNENKKIESKEKSYQLIRVRHCEYCIRIEARSIMGSTPQNDPICFGPVDEGFDPLLFAAVFTPLVIAFLVAVTCCCWIFKDHILPKVPKPRDLLSDNLDNNNVSSLHKLYISAEEEENCCVTLIIDTQTNKPNC